MHPAGCGAAGCSGTARLYVGSRNGKCSILEAYLSNLPNALIWWNMTKTLSFLLWGSIDRSSSGLSGGIVVLSVQLFTPI
jgi:hypothetical protein